MKTTKTFGVDVDEKHSVSVNDCLKEKEQASLKMGEKMTLQKYFGDSFPMLVNDRLLAQKWHCLLFYYREQTKKT